MPTPRTRKSKTPPTLAPDDPLNVAAEQAAQGIAGFVNTQTYVAKLLEEGKAAPRMTAAQRLAALIAAGFSEDDALQMLAAKAQPPAPLPPINPGGETGEDEFSRLRAEELARYQARMRDYVAPATHETFEVTVPARTADYLRRKQMWHGEETIGRVIEVIIRTYRQNDPVRLDLESTGQTGRASAFDPKTGRFG